MDLTAVRDELVVVLKTITGLRAYAYDPGQIQTPAALVGWPEEISYVETYGRGKSRCPDLPLLLLVGKAAERTAAKLLGQYVATAGARSVPAKIESHTWTACDSVTVTKVSFPAVKYSGVDYLAAEFHNDVIGGGA